jgi:hypothetical protein
MRRKLLTSTLLAAAATAAAVLTMTPAHGDPAPAATSISGVVRAGDTYAGLPGVKVSTFTTVTSKQGVTKGTFVTSTTTDSLGKYTLVINPGTYDVCFGVVTAALAKYSSQCYAFVPWANKKLGKDGRTVVPTEATHVTATAGQAIVNINATLDAGAIAGTVTVANTTTPIANVVVVLYGTAATPLSATATKADGTYKFIGLIATAGYRICFNGGAGIAGKSLTTHYSNACYLNVAWSGTGAPAATATPITVALDTTTEGISAALTVKGA